MRHGKASPAQTGTLIENEEMVKKENGYLEESKVIPLPYSGWYN